MSYALVLNLTTVNYKKGNSGRKYIVIHYTGNTTDTAMNNANYFKSVNRGASAHYFVDKTQIVQVVKEEDTAWAVGRNYGSNNLFGQCTNSNSISIEMCSTNGKIADETYKNTVELTKDLMNRYGISVDKVVRHWDVCSKVCPGWDGWGANGKDASIWNQFKKDISSETVSTPPSIDSSSSSVPSSSKSILTVDGKWGTATTKRLQEIFGTVQDGKVSNQWSKYKQDGCYTGWEWKTSPTGSSALIKAIQRKVGATVDGWIGTNTIKAMQKYWGTVQDGKISEVSSLVKAIQRWANSQ